MIPALFVVFVLAILLTARSVVIVPSGRIYVVERLGRLHRRVTEGVTFIAPFIDRVAEKYALEAAPVTIDFQVISRDNVPLRVTGSATYRVEDAAKVHTGVADVPNAVNQLLRTALITEAGKRTVTEMREENRLFRSDTQKAADAIASQMGIRIVAVEAGVTR